MDQLHDAVEASAKFIVCPGSDKELIEEAIRLGVHIVPGIVTSADIMMVLKLDLSVFKFFPAEPSAVRRPSRRCAVPSRRSPSSPPKEEITINFSKADYNRRVIYQQMPRKILKKCIIKF